MKKYKTIFCDIDGTVFNYRKFDDIETVKAVPIQSTLDYLKSVKDEGGMIIMTTARPDSMYLYTYKELQSFNIPFDTIITGINRGERILINDLDPDDESKLRAIGINLKRDKGFNNEELYS
jgi:hydroxymethylpyrimidine pyrophosphatase-like HAD family hydrolase